MFHNKFLRQGLRPLTVLSLFTLTCFSSCEKQVELPHSKLEEKLVIAGEISDQQGDCMVKLTTSKTYGQSGNFEPVSHAAVTIKDESGNVSTLNETGPGIYTNPLLAGKSGKRYMLTVTANGKTYTASSAMPTPTPIDSVYFENETDTTLSTLVMFKDQPGIENYYQLAQSISGVKDGISILANDKNADGRAIMQRIYFSAYGVTVHRGDKVTVELKSLEKPVYQFLENFDMNRYYDADKISSLTKSNVSGGALGYFSANAVQRKTVTAH